MKHKETREISCRSCDATGLYVGIGERDGAAVVCHTCKGTGKETLTVEWRDFEGRRPAKNITWVYAANPGIVAAPKVVPGGVPYDEWQQDARSPFRLGHEMRAHTCPAWWYQTADYDKKPRWDECDWGRFTECRLFAKKAKCWERFDKENKK